MTVTRFFVLCMAFLLCPLSTVIALTSTQQSLGVVGVVPAAISNPVFLSAPANAVFSNVQPLNAEQAALLEKFHSACISLIKTGEDYLFVIPSDVYFYPDSTHLKSNNLSVFGDIAAYMNQFTIVSVTVAGYTDRSDRKADAIAFTRQQAQNIMDELRLAHLEVTMIDAVGKGNSVPIAYNNTVIGRSANRRVQITFRVVGPVFHSALSSSNERRTC